MFANLLEMQIVCLRLQQSICKFEFLIVTNVNKKSICQYSIAEFFVDFIHNLLN